MALEPTKFDCSGLVTGSAAGVFTIALTENGAPAELTNYVSAAVRVQPGQGRNAFDVQAEIAAPDVTFSLTGAETAQMTGTNTVHVWLVGVDGEKTSIGFGTLRAKESF